MEIKLLNKTTFQTGQALVIMLVIMAMTLTLIAATAAMVTVNSQTATFTESGSDAQYAAESGIENALLRLVRNASYSGETLIIGTDSVVVTVTGAGTKTIQSVATSGTFHRTVTVTVQLVNGVITVQSWQESF